MDKIILVLILSFLLNLPLGMWRSKVKKFGLYWFLSVHLAVPIIYLLRIEFDLVPWTIPIFILAAILGQVAGGKLIRIKEVKEVTISWSAKKSA